MVPKTRTEWWRSKIERNKQLDLENLCKLIDEGWTVLCIFECELKAVNRAETFNKTIKQLEENYEIKNITNH